MRSALSFLAASWLVLSVAPSAWADNYDSLVKPAPPTAEAKPGSTPPAPPPDIDKPAKRRGGVVLGFELGVGLAGSSGYPNNSNQIGNPDYYAASGLMTGSGGT